jgi:hypothetical protein
MDFHDWVGFTRTKGKEKSVCSKECSERLRLKRMASQSECGSLPIRRKRGIREEGKPDKTFGPSPPYPAAIILYWLNHK